MSQATRHDFLKKELMAELIKANPDRAVVRDRARRLGFKHGDDIEALMAEVLEKTQSIRPKSKRRSPEVTP